MSKPNAGVFIDVIPAGTYYSPAPLTRKQIITIGLVRRIGKYIAAEHPEVAVMYGDLENPLISQLDIARKIMPVETARFPNVMKKAVGYAIRSLRSETEQREITRARRAIYLEEKVGGYGSKEFSNHCKEARRRKEELGIKSDISAMVAGRNQVLWDSAERQYVIELTRNPNYQIQKGQFKGAPDYELIASELNEKFHGGKNVRYHSSVGNFVRNLRRRPKGEQK